MDNSTSDINSNNTIGNNNLKVSDTFFKAYTRQSTIKAPCKDGRSSIASPPPPIERKDFARLLEIIADKREPARYEIEKLAYKYRLCYDEYGTVKNVSKGADEEEVEDVVNNDVNNDVNNEVNNVVKVGFKRLLPYAYMPTKAHATDSGYDLYAAETRILGQGDTIVIPTGIAVVLPIGYEAQVRPRSGVTSETSFRVQLGTIDNGYRGEIGIIVDNIDVEELPDTGFDERAHIYKGDRIAQLVVQELPKTEAYEVKGELEETVRGDRGYGSTGV